MGHTPLMPPPLPLNMSKRDEAPVRQQIKGIFNPIMNHRRGACVPHLSLYGCRVWDFKKLLIGKIQEQSGSHRAQVLVISLVRSLAPIKTSCHQPTLLIFMQLVCPPGSQANLLCLVHSGTMCVCGIQHDTHGLADWCVFEQAPSKP